MWTEASQMNRLPDFSAVSRSMEAPVSERVSLHIGSPETAAVGHGTLSCESQISQCGTVSLNEISEEGDLKKVDWLLSDSCEYIVVFIALSDDRRSAEFQIKASQDTEEDVED